MDRSLVAHPDTPSRAVSGITVALSFAKADRCVLRYTVRGAIDRLRLPPEALHPRRRDELWKTSCFEAFVRDGQGESYAEFNLSPSGDWAAYRLAGYRTALVPALIAPPSIKSRQKLGQLVVTVGIDLGKAVDTETDWTVGLSAVIEEDAGVRSYWALAHPPGAPDFHHRDCFALDLPASARA